MNKKLYLLLIVIILLTSSVNALQLDWPPWGTAFSQDDAVLVSNTNYCKNDCELIINVTQREKDFILGKDNEQIDYKIKQLKNNKGSVDSVVWEKREWIESIPIYDDVMYAYFCDYEIEVGDNYASCYREEYNEKNKSTSKINVFSASDIVNEKSLLSGTIQYTKREIVDYNNITHIDWTGEAPGVKNLRIYVNGEQFEGNFEKSKATKEWKRGETFEIKVTGSLIHTDDFIDIIPSMLGLDITKFAVWNSTLFNTTSTPNVSGVNSDSTQLLYLKKFRQMSSEHELWDYLVEGWTMEEDGNLVGLKNFLNLTENGAVSTHNSMLGFNQTKYGYDASNYYSGSTDFGFSRDDDWTISFVLQQAVARAGNDDHFFELYDDDATDCPQLLGIMQTDGDLLFNAWAFGGTTYRWAPAVGEYGVVTITNDGTTQQQLVYLNGVQIIDQTNTESCGDNYDKLLIGKSTNGGYEGASEGFNDFYIFNKTLTATEASSLYYDNMCTRLINASIDGSDIETYDSDTDTTVPHITVESIMGIYDSYTPDEICDFPDFNTSLRFDETSGTDFTALCGSDATGGGSVTAGYDSLWLLNNSPYYDGVNDYIETDSDFGFADGDSFSIGMWVRNDNKDGGTSDTSLVFEHYEATGTGLIRLYDDSTDVWRLQINDGTHNCGATGTTPIVNGQWFYLVATWDDNACKLYVDGELEASDTEASMGALTAAPFIFGLAWDYANYDFTGLIDNVMIWDKALTQEEIKRYMNPDAIIIPSPYWNQSTNLSSNIKVSATGVSQAVTNADTDTTRVNDLRFEPGMNNAQLKNYASNSIIWSTSTATYTQSNCPKGSGCYHFDGSGDVISSTRTGDLTSLEGLNHSVSAWVIFDDIYYRPIYQLGTVYVSSNYYGLLINLEIARGADGPRIWFFTWDGDSGNNEAGEQLSTSTDIEVGVLYHVVAVFDNTNNMKYIYLNGSLDNSVAYTGALDFYSTSGNCELIGQRAYNSGCGTVQFIHNGTIDDVRTYTSALTASEVEGLFNEGSHIPEYWSSEAPGPSTSVSLTTPVWTTTGGFSSGNRIYGQAIDNITSNGSVTGADDSGVLGMNITIISPMGMNIADNVAMTNLSGTADDVVFVYNTDVVLNEAGVWNITTEVYYGSYTDNASSTVTVATSNFTTSNNHYGFTTGGIPSEAQLASYITDYTYDLIEITDNITTMNANWATILSRFNTSYNSNLVGGLNIILDVDCTDQGAVNTYKTQIASDWPDLLTGNYQSAIIYLSLEFLNNSYTTAEADDCFNNISKSIVSATNNQYIVYAKEYNGSGLDDSYIMPTTMKYNEEVFAATFINWEAATSRDTSYLNRIYNTNLQSATLLNIGEDLQNKAYKILRTGINASTTIVNTSVAELLNGDILAFNNLSLNWVNKTITVKTGSGKDVYDKTNKDIIATDTDLTFNVSVSNYSVTYIMLDDLDHYQLTSNTEGTLYKATTSGWSNFSWDDGTRDGASQVDATTWRSLFLYDPKFETGGTVYDVYYGWLNASYVQNWSAYEFVIIADKNNVEIDRVVTQTNFFGYVGVFDYDESNATWVADKKAQVDEWFALNNSMAGIFLDGLDYATITNATDFEVKFKQIVDHVRIDLGKLAYLNTYTYSEDYCTWGDACMKESCVRRWNGADASNPDSYSWEDWSLELEKSTYYNSHNIQIICQGFDNRSLVEPHQVQNYTRMVDAFYASKVLGYEYWSWSQPDFQYALDIYIPDVGTDMSSSWQTDDNETYYRLYSNGIVYYNTSSHHGWQDNGRVYNNVTLFANLHDDATPQVYHILVSDGDIDSTQYDYTVTTAGAGWAYNTYEIELNSSSYNENGRYKIEVYGDTGVAYLGFDSSGDTWQGYRSWYSTDSGSTWNKMTVDTFYMFTLGLNDSNQASLDSNIEIVSQTDTVNSEWQNISLLSVHDYVLDTWTLPTEARLRTFDNLSYWDGSAWNNLYPQNTSTCDTDNPIWNTTTIGADDYNSCYEYDGFEYIFRIKYPHMSQQDAGVFGLPPQYVNSLSVTPANPRYNTKLYCNFNVSTLDTSTELDVSITWYNSSDNSTWTNVGTYNTTYYNVTLNESYTTTIGNGSVSETLSNYSYWYCQIGIDDGITIYYESSASVPVFPLENLTIYSETNLTESNAALNATFNVIDYDGGIECLLDINETNVEYAFDDTTEICYQESVNVANQSGIDGNCGQQYIGNYTADASVFYPERIYDGDWSTYGFPTHSAVSFFYYYPTYYKPTIPPHGAVLQFKTNDGTINTTINQSCFDYSEETLQIRVLFNKSNSGSMIQCYDGSWVDVVQSSTTSGAFYEEGIYWNVTSYKINSWVTQNKSDNIGYEFYDSGAGGWYWYNFTNRESNYLNWSIEYTNATSTYYDVEIPNRCRDTSVVQIRDTFDAFGNEAVECYNSTDWEELLAITFGEAYVSYGLEWINFNESVINGTNTTIQYRPSVDGVYAWDLSCRATGNEIPLVSDSLIYRYDTTAPTFTDNTTSETDDFPEIGDVIELNTTIHDMFSIANCTLQINDNTTWWNSTINTYIGIEEEVVDEQLFTVRDTSLANNTVVYWRVVCSDLAGNYNTSDNSSFTVKDRTFPIVQNASTGNNWFANITKHFSRGTPITDSGSDYGIINVNRNNLTMNFTYFDYNLFQVEELVICDINGTIYNYTMLDYNTTNLTVESTVPLTGMDFQRCSINISMSDDHTIEKIPDYKIDTINNGLEFNTENNNLISIALTKDKDVKKPLFRHTEIKKVKTNKKTDRYNFDFEFDEPITKTTFTISASNKIYYREGSNYPGHFVVWNDELKRGNWIDFAELEIDISKYKVKKISDYEYEVSITLDTPKKNFMFESIGGTNVYNATYYFYTGGEVLLMGNSSYDDTAVQDWNISVTTLNAYPGWNGSATINASWVYLENLTNGTYQLDFTHYCYFPGTYILNITNTTQNLTWDTHQSEWSFRISDVATGTFLSDWNVSIYNTDSGQWHNFTNVNSSGIQNLILNATTYTINITAAEYDDNVFNYTFSCQENLTSDIEMSFLATFFLYDENTLDVFNVSSPNTIYFVLMCPNSTETSVITTNVTTIPITCDYDKFRFIMDYGTTSYFRTFILEPDDAHAVDIFLIDAATTTYVSNNFIVDDLVDEYEDVQVFVYKMIGDVKTQITADWIDIESKITAYLIQNHEYILEIHSSNKPVRVMGNYVAAESGDKALKLYSIDLDYASTSFINNIHVAQGSINKTNLTTNTSDVYAVLRLQGYTYTASPVKNLTSVQYDLMFDSCTATPFYTWTETDTSVLWTTTGIEHTYNISEYANRTICSNTTLIATDADGNTQTTSFTKLIQTYDKIQQDIFNFVTHNWMNWFIMILLGTIALMGTIKSENYSVLAVVLLGALLAAFGWFTLSKGILAVAILLTLISVLKSKEKKLY